MTPTDYIKHLNLQGHPEGGYLCETHRSAQTLNFDGFSGPRSLSTSIVFMLCRGQQSAMHRIKSEELWYFQDGDGIEIIEQITEDRQLITRLGRRVDQGEKLQHVVPAGRWFGARLPSGAAFCLVGCQVSPGFDFQDFELQQH